MDKKILSMTLLSLLLIAAYVPIASAHNAPFPGGYDPTHLVIETIGGPETIDPAWCYDTASAEIISAMYDTLIFFDNVWTDGPYNAGKTDEFVYKLATSETVETGSWPGPGGITFVKRFTYTIRTGVKFHDGSIMTPEDIEYSFERWMVQDRDGGPQWMIYEPLLGEYYAKSPAEDALYGQKIDAAVEAIGNTVQFSCVLPFPENTFRQIISQSWAGIVEKSWGAAQGDFDGNWAAGWATIYDTWHNPETSHIEGLEMGTGPYKLSYWTPDVAWSIQRFAGYWDGWPARVYRERFFPTYRAASTTRIGGFLEKVTWYEVPDWTARRATFLAGGSDMTYVPRAHRSEVLDNEAHSENVLVNGLFDAGEAIYRDVDISGTVTARDVLVVGSAQPDGTVLIAFAADEKHTENIEANTLFDAGEAIYRDVDNNNIVTAPDVLLLDPAQPAGTALIPFQAAPRVGGEKIRCFYPFQVLGLEAFFFTFVVSDTQTAPYMYDPNPAGTFSEFKYPIDFFDDINARKGFAYAFDYASWLSASYLGEGYQPPDYIIEGLLYDKGPNDPTPYSFDMTKAAQYLKQVGIGATGDDPLTPEGALWDAGIKFTVSYNTGNVGRQTAAEMISSKMNSLNTKFHVDTTAVSWGTVYLPKMVARELPVFIIGWLADYPDPHNFAFPFAHSLGTFAQWQGYSDPHVDDLIETGIMTPDGPARQAIYYELQDIYHDDVPSVPLVQPIGRHWEQAWMRGWYYTPLYGGSLALGIDSTAPAAPTIYVYHLWKAKTHFGDANNDGAVNVGDVGVVSAHWTGPPAGVSGYNPRADMTGGTGGTTGSSSGLVKGIWDGKVSIADAGLISAYWDGPPKGPSHP